MGNVQVGDVVRYKDGSNFNFGHGPKTAKVTSIIGHKIWVNTDTWLIDTTADKFLEIVQRGNDMNERSAELLERVAQLIREDKNVCDYFQHYVDYPKGWKDYKEVDQIFLDIMVDPNCIREKPQRMNLGGYEIPMPIQNQPEEMTDVWCVNMPSNAVECRKFYHLGYTGECFRKNLLHYDEKSAQQHLDVLKKLHGIG